MEYNFGEILSLYCDKTVIELEQKHTKFLKKVFLTFYNRIFGKNIDDDDCLEMLALSICHTR